MKDFRASTEHPLIFVIRGRLENLPPVLSVICSAARIRPVNIIASSCSDRARACIERSGASLIVIGGNPEGLTLADKVRAALVFRRAVWAAIRELGTRAVLWIVNPHTAIILGRRLFEYQYILHLLEIDDPYWVKTLVRPFVLRAAVVVSPRIERSAILRHWFQLNTTPAVVTNYPGPFRSERRQSISDPRAGQVLDGLPPTSKIVLYQGLIRPDRDLTAVAQGVHEMGPPWQMVVMGKDFGPLANLQKHCPSLIHVPYIGAPGHLEVTSHAYIGVISYDFASLNNIFCAPNKVYEYSLFGIPMLCNDVPGLVTTVGRQGAGVCADLATKRGVIAALEQMEHTYGAFSEASSLLHTSVDVDREVQAVLESARGPQ